MRCSVCKAASKVAYTSAAKRRLLKDEEALSDLVQQEICYGTRLDRDASPDVPRLCGVAINAYLTMLLDTGVLHCDP